MKVIHECPVCGEEITVDYSSKDDKVSCPDCLNLFSVDTDAELIDGRWIDRTSLHRVIE